MKKDHKEVCVAFHGQQWKYLQVIATEFEGTKVTAEKLRKYINEKPQRIRSYLSELVTGEYLEADTLCMTEKGKRAYEEQMFWKNELTWWMKKLNVPAAARDAQADRLLDAMEPEVIWQIYMQNEYVRMLEATYASKESFNNSDLSGRLCPGIYKAQIEFLEKEKEQGESGYIGFSKLNRCFERQARMMIEPLKSNLVLTWNNEYGILSEAVYYWEGKMRCKKAQKNQLVIPIADMNFSYVRTYHMLEGMLDLSVFFRDEKGTKACLSACLMVSMAVNERK